MGSHVLRCSVLAVWFLCFRLPVAFAQTPLDFIAITPCRIADTRNANGPFGGPVLAAVSTRSFPIASSSCNIPANAAVYSLNITVVISGTPVNVVTVWPTGQAKPLVSTLNVPLGATTANAALVPAGTGGAINVYVSDQTNLIIDINGYFIPQTTPAGQSTAVGSGASSAGSQNTAVGYNALQLNSGTSNTATGTLSLSSNVSGNNNVAVGTNALQFNASGSANTGLGTLALLNNLSGGDNTATGFSSLSQNTIGNENTADGVNALSSNSSGSGNTAVGTSALSGSTYGSRNLAVGYQAGNQVTTGSYNVEIANSGQNTDSNTLRIGDPSNQTSAYIAGINGVNVGSGSTVLINSNGQLGTIQSALRYKQDIANIGAVSDGLMRLRPVMFRYKQSADAGAGLLQYGLIGEEVEKVFPELVIHRSDGQVESVAYHELPSLLLNELQKQHRLLDAQEQCIARQEEELRTLRTRIGFLEKQAHLNSAPVQR